MTVWLQLRAPRSAVPPLYRYWRALIDGYTVAMSQFEWLHALYALSLYTTCAFVLVTDPGYAAACIHDLPTNVGGGLELNAHRARARACIILSFVTCVRNVIGWNTIDWGLVCFLSAFDRLTMLYDSIGLTMQLVWSTRDSFH